MRLVCELNIYVAEYKLIFQTAASIITEVKPDVDIFFIHLEIGFGYLPLSAVICVFGRENRGKHL